MTYNVFGGTLSLTQSINQSRTSQKFVRHFNLRYLNYNVNYLQGRVLIRYSTYHTLKRRTFKVVLTEGN